MSQFFPCYSNLYPELKEVLESRVENTNKPLQQGGVSGLAVWIRVMSAAGDGLILESIHKPESFEQRYGNNSKPGILGYNLAGNPVEVSGRGFRPSPVITTFSIEETQQGALKNTNFTIRCFTIEQLNEISKYFLEPGFYVLAEWGWNVNDSYSQRVGSGGKIEICDIVSYNNWKYLKEKRQNSKYQYDASLGIIAGGGVKFGDSETYDLEVKLTGQGQVAEYLQVQTGGNKTNGEEGNNVPSFEPEEVGKSKVGPALFKQMFNALPNPKKTDYIKELVNQADLAYEGNFVNFDEEVRDYLSSTLSKGATIRNKSNDKLEIPTDSDFFSNERFIRFGLAIKIFNSYVVDLEEKKSSCPKVVTAPKIITTENTIIKAFPHMWSTDKSILYIPNTQAPNFGLKEVLVDSGNETPIKYINYKELSNKDFQANLHPIVSSAPAGHPRFEKNGSAHDPATGQSRPVPFAFPCLFDLDETVLNYECDESVKPRQEKAGYWGYLDDLYINFDFFTECLSKANMNSLDVVYEMLNGMSSACNSIWNFQLREGPKIGDAEGPQIMTVEDVNFTGNISKDTLDNVDIFQARGTKSPFISFSWDMTIAGAMQSSIMIKRMSGSDVDGGGDIPTPLFGKVFSDPKELEDKVGTVLMNLISQGVESEEDEEPQPPPPSNAKAFDLFSKRAGVFSRVQDRKGKIDIVNNLTDKEQAKKSDGTIESLLCVGTWDDKSALKQVELIDRARIVSIPADVDKKYANNVNPIPGLAKVQFQVQGLSGFKIGDMLQFEGIPYKYGAPGPSFYQITKTAHSISGTTWLTDITCEFRLIGEEE